jgi:hypothetical protein
METKIERLKKRVELAEARLKEIENGRKGNRLDENVKVIDKQQLMFIAFLLFLRARINFRGVARVLSVLSGYLGIMKAPCVQSIINWITRLSIARIEGVTDQTAAYGYRVVGDRLSNGFIWIMDITIGLNGNKILSVIAIPAAHHKLYGEAPSLLHAHCCAVEVSATWNGELEADFLKELIGTLGCPLGIIKDRGGDMVKAIRLLGESGIKIHVIDDISHVIANLLKHQYANHPLFESFISTCGKISKKLKQTILACPAPPKTSIKTRFMNIHKLFTWAQKFLKHSSAGRAAKGSLLEKLRKHYADLPAYTDFINWFVADLTPLMECQRILKNSGFSNETLTLCRPLFKQIPSVSVRSGIIQWADKQMETAKAIFLDNIGMPITSDSIESLFGVAKRHGTGEIKDANRIALRMPALCGTVTMNDALIASKITVKKQNLTTANMKSITAQRRDVLPNPGSLETLNSKSCNSNVKLFPVPKTSDGNETINLEPMDPENPKAPTEYVGCRDHNSSANLFSKLSLPSDIERTASFEIIEAQKQGQIRSSI